MKLRWLSAALTQLDQVHEYIAQENPKAAKLVFTRIQGSAEKLRRFPNAGRLGHAAGTRELVVANLPYVIVYRVTETDVEILRVWHSSQGFQ